MELLSLVDWSTLTCPPVSYLPTCLLPLCTNSVPEKLQFPKVTALCYFIFICDFSFGYFLCLEFSLTLITWRIPMHPVKHLKCNSSLKPSPIDQERSNYVFPSLFRYRFCLLLFSPQELGMHVVHPGKLVLTLKHCSQPFLSRYILSYLFYMVIILIHIPWHTPVIFINKPLYCKVFIT